MTEQQPNETTRLPLSVDELVDAIRENLGERWTEVDTPYDSQAEYERM